MTNVPKSVTNGGNADSLNGAAHTATTAAQGAAAAARGSNGQRVLKQVNLLRGTMTDDELDAKRASHRVVWKYAPKYRREASSSIMGDSVNENSGTPAAAAAAGFGRPRQLSRLVQDAEEGETAAAAPVMPLSGYTFPTQLQEQDVGTAAGTPTAHYHYHNNNPQNNNNNNNNVTADFTRDWSGIQEGGGTPLHLRTSGGDLVLCPACELRNSGVIRRSLLLTPLANDKDGLPVAASSHNNTTMNGVYQSLYNSAFDTVNAERQPTSAAGGGPQRYDSQHSSSGSIMLPPSHASNGNNNNNNNNNNNSRKPSTATPIVRSLYPGGSASAPNNNNNNNNNNLGRRISLPSLTSNKSQSGGAGQVPTAASVQQRPLTTTNTQPNTHTGAADKDALLHRQVSAPVPQRPHQRHRHSSKIRPYNNYLTGEADADEVVTNHTRKRSSGGGDDENERSRSFVSQGGTRFPKRDLHKPLLNEDDDDDDLNASNRSGVRRSRRGSRSGSAVVGEPQQTYTYSPEYLAKLREQNNAVGYSTSNAGNSRANSRAGSRVGSAAKRTSSPKAPPHVTPQIPPEAAATTTAHKKAPAPAAAATEAPTTRAAPAPLARKKLMHRPIKREVVPPPEPPVAKRTTSKTTRTPSTTRSSNSNNNNNNNNNKNSNNNEDTKSHESADSTTRSAPKVRAAPASNTNDNKNDHDSRSADTSTLQNSTSVLRAKKAATSPKKTATAAALAAHRKKQLVNNYNNKHNTNARAPASKKLQLSDDDEAIATVNTSRPLSRVTSRVGSRAGSPGTSRTNL